MISSYAVTATCSSSQGNRPTTYLCTLRCSSVQELLILYNKSVDIVRDGNCSSHVVTSIVGCIKEIVSTGGCRAGAGTCCAEDVRSGDDRLIK